MRERLRIITFKIPETLLDELDELARAMSITRSEALRRAVAEWISREKKRISPQPRIVRLYS